MDLKLVLAITVLLVAEICVFVTSASYMETYCEQLQCKKPRHFFTAFTDTENSAEAQAVLTELGIDVQQFQRNVLSAIDAETKAYPNARSLVSDGSAIQECRDPKTCLGLLAYWPSESIGDALSDIGVNQRRLREIVAAFDSVAVTARKTLSAKKLGEICEKGDQCEKGSCDFVDNTYRKRACCFDFDDIEKMPDFKCEKNEECCRGRTECDEGRCCYGKGTHIDDPKLCCSGKTRKSVSEVLGTRNLCT